MATIDAPHLCETMLYALDEPDLPLFWVQDRQQYVLECSGLPALLPLAFCPFCGAALTASPTAPSGETGD